MLRRFHLFQRQCFIREQQWLQKNGHLFIDTLLSKHSMACAQETKFRDAAHLSNFEFHLESGFQHKLFVDDTNCRLVRPTQGRTSGVFTLFRSDFPGFDTATVVDTLSVPNRYLVVKLTIEDMPVYVHNVYAPVDNLRRRYDSTQRQVFSKVLTVLKQYAPFGNYASSNTNALRVLTIEP